MWRLCHACSQPALPAPEIVLPGPGRTLATRMWVSFYRSVLFAFAGLAPDTAARLGAALGACAFHLGVRRATVSSNLARTLHLRGRHRRRVAQRCYQHVAATFVEAWGIHSCPVPARILNPQWLAHLRRGGRGMVFVSLHLGNWDAAGAAVARATGKMMVFARRQRDQVLNDVQVALRIQSGISIVFAKHGRSTDMLSVLRLLRGGGCLGLMADQLPRRHEGCEGYFLGVPTRLHTGPAVLARLSRSILVPGVSLRCGNGEHIFIAGRPVPAAATDEETTQRCMDVLAAMIAAHPEQYFWHHRRFKRVVTLPPRLTMPSGLQSWGCPPR